MIIIILQNINETISLFLRYKKKNTSKIHLPVIIRFNKNVIFFVIFI